MKAFLLSLLLIVTPGVFAQVPAPEFPTTEQDELYAVLMQEVRCLVCQNQAIGDSSAALAGDLRREIARLVEEGRSEDEIKVFLLERYGDFVLYKPRVAGNTLLLWFAPAIFLLIAVAVIFSVVRRRSALPVDIDAPMDDRSDT